MQMCFVGATQTGLKYELLLQTVPDLYKYRGFKAAPDPLMAMMQTVSSLRLTIWSDVEQMIPVQDIGKLSLREFAKIYTVCAQLFLIL